LHEIVINDLQEGIFYSKLVCSNEHDNVDIDSRTSDALALAVRSGCPIFTYENILEQAGVLMDNDQNFKQESTSNIGKVSSDSTNEEDNLTSLSLEELNTMLTDVLEKEDYIKAISIRDELKKRGASS